MISEIGTLGLEMTWRRIQEPHHCSELDGEIHTAVDIYAAHDRLQRHDQSPLACTRHSSVPAAAAAAVLHPMLIETLCLDRKYAAAVRSAATDGGDSCIEY